MRARSILCWAAAMGLTGALWTEPARAQQACSRVVVYTLPGVTWEQVAEDDPPVLGALAEEGAIGSMSVRTNSSRTSYSSGFATIGAGTRVDGGVTTGASVGDVRSSEAGDLSENVVVAGIGEVRSLAAEDGYDAVPGALGAAVAPLPTTAIGNAETSIPPRSPEGFERWTLLAAMDPSGNVDLAAVGDDLLAVDEQTREVRTNEGAIANATRAALARRCGVTIIDHGDLIRSELDAGPDGPSRAERRAALLASDDLLGIVDDLLSPEDLLVVVSPTSPMHDDDVQLGVAVARGPGFGPGTVLSSASTRRAGVVTLPDIAPTILEHLGIARPPAMLGRPFFTLEPSGDRIAAAIESNREAVFIDRMRPPVTTVFVVAQVVLYILIAALFHGHERKGRAPPTRWPELVTLAVVAFPLCTYLAGIVSQHRLGPWGYGALLAALDVALVVVVTLLLSATLDRLLALTAATCAVLVVDVLVGAPLQVNTAFSYSPLVAGRFAGLGNTAFSVLGAVTVVTGTLIVHRARGSRWSVAATGILFAVVVIVDGAPMWGSDVGGVLALVPALAVTLMLLSDKRPTVKGVVVAGIAALLVLALFLALDLARSPDDRSHLARLFEDVQARGGGALMDTISRKVETNLRVFTSTIWTYLVPPALALIAWLLLRPRRRWERFAHEYPTLRAGLIGGLVLSVMGFAVNDSGIVVPAVILGYLVPVAVLAHVLLERRKTA